MLHAYFLLQTTHQVLFAQKEGRGRVPVSIFLGLIRCLKTIGKVSLNIASAQKIIKTTKMVHFGHFGEFLKIEACSQTVLPDRSLLIGPKLVENAKIKKFNCDILSNFQTMFRCCSE